jgi:hypothetical protein
MYLKSIKTRLHSLLRFAFEQHFENLIINCRESFKYLKEKIKSTELWMDHTVHKAVLKDIEEKKNQSLFAVLIEPTKLLSVH